MIRTLVAAAGAAALIACAAPVDDQETDSAPRVGGTWTAVSVPGLDAFDPFDAPRAQFTLDSSVRGAAGCFDFSAPVVFAGERISVGRFSLQRDPACGPPRDVIGRAFLEALASAEIISGGLPGNRLILSGPEGELVLAQPPPSPTG